MCDIPDRVIDTGTREAFADFLTAYPVVARHESQGTTRAFSLGPRGPRHLITGQRCPVRYWVVMSAWQAAVLAPLDYRP